MAWRLAVGGGCADRAGPGLQPVAGGAGHQPEQLHQDPAVGVDRSGPVGRREHLVEGVAHRHHIVGALQEQPGRVEPHGVVLAPVVHVELQPEAHRVESEALLGHVPLGQRDQASNDIVEGVGRVGVVVAVEELDHAGALVGLHHRHGGHAVGVELAAVREGGHGVHIGVAGHRGRVHRTGPAEREHGEVAGIVALQGGLAVDLLAHHAVDQAPHPHRRLGHVDAERVRDAAAQGPLGPAPAQGHGPSQEPVGVDEAQHHVGVGDGRLGAPLRVAGRAGHGAGAAGAHPQLTGVGEMGDRPSARADRVVGDHRQVHPPAVDHRVELVVAVLPVDHQAHVEAGAAHVGGDHPVESVVAGHGGRAGQAGHRTAAQQVQGGGAAGRGHPADVAGHQQRLAASQRPQPVAEVDDVLLGVGGQEGAEDGGDAAPVLVEAGGHVRRQQHRAAAEHRVGVLPPHDLGHLLLVGRVHERPRQAHRDGSHALADQVVDRGQHVVGAQRHEHLAEAVDALPHPHPQRPGHQVVGPLGPGAVDLHLQGHAVGPGAGAGHVHGVLLARGGDEPHLGAGPLDQGVGAHGGGVLDRVDRGEGVGRVAAEPPGRLADGFDHAVGQVGVGGRRLAGGLAPAQHHEGVGEGPPDVHVEQARPAGADLARSRGFSRRHRGRALCRG